MKRIGRILACILCLALTAALSAAFAESAVPPEEAVPVWKFCHALSPEGLDTAVITLFMSDCEEGLIPKELSEEEAAFIRDLAVNGTVREKVSDLCVTGGTWIYTFRTPAGDYLLSVELYEGMLAGPYGMYRYELKRDLPASF